MECTTIIMLVWCGIANHTHDLMTRSLGVKVALQRHTFSLEEKAWGDAIPSILFLSLHHGYGSEFFAPN